ncbi:MAG: hypothetical protein U0P81_07020 [Holophagaceae bacterium]
MVKREPVRPSPKLLALLKDFQQIAAMAGYLTHVMDAPQLRMLFTLYARIMAPTEEAALAAVPDLQAWCERVGTDLREGSSSAVLPPQVLIANPQPLPSGMWLLVATMNFNTKVTDASYQRVRTAVLRAYQRAMILRDKGLDVAKHLLEQPESWDAVSTAQIPLIAVPAADPELPLPEASEPEDVPASEGEPGPA